MIAGTEHRAFVFSSGPCLRDGGRHAARDLKSGRGIQAAVPRPAERYPQMRGNPLTDFFALAQEGCAAARFGLPAALHLHVGETHFAIFCQRARCAVAPCRPAGGPLERSGREGVGMALPAAGKPAGDLGWPAQPLWRIMPDTPARKTGPAVGAAPSGAGFWALGMHVLILF